MNNNCDVCHVGKLQLYQYTLDKAVWTCGNGDCTYYFEKEPSEMIIEHPFMTPEARKRWPQFTSAGVRAASRNPSPTYSLGSSTDREVQKYCGQGLSDSVFMPLSQDSSQDKQVTPNGYQSNNETNFLDFINGLKTETVVHPVPIKNDVSDTVNESIQNLQEVPQVPKLSEDLNGGHSNSISDLGSYSHTPVRSQDSPEGYDETLAILDELVEVFKGSENVPVHSKLDASPVQFDPPAEVIPDCQTEKNEIAHDNQWLNQILNSSDEEKTHTNIVSEKEPIICDIPSGSREQSIPAIQENNNNTNVLESEASEVLENAVVKPQILEEDLALSDTDEEDTEEPDVSNSLPTKETSGIKDGCGVYKNNYLLIPDTENNSLTTLRPMCSKNDNVKDLWACSPEMVVEQLDVEIMMNEKPKSPEPMTVFEPVVMKPKIVGPQNSVNVSISHQNISQCLSDDDECPSRFQMSEKAESSYPISLHYSNVLSDINFNEGCLDNTETSPLEDSITLGALDWSSDSSDDEVPIISIESDDEVSLIGIQQQKKIIVKRKKRRINLSKRNSKPQVVEDVVDHSSLHSYGRLHEPISKLHGKASPEFEDTIGGYEEFPCFASPKKRICEDLHTPVKRLRLDTPNISQTIKTATTKECSSKRLLETLNHTKDIKLINPFGWKVMVGNPVINYKQKSSQLPTIIPTALRNNSVEQSSDVTHWNLTSKKYLPSSKYSTPKQKTNPKKRNLFLNGSNNFYRKQTVPLLSSDGGSNDDEDHNEFVNERLHPPVNKHNPTSVSRQKYKKTPISKFKKNIKSPTDNCEVKRAEIEKTLMQELKKCKTPPSVMCVTVNGKLYICSEVAS